MNATRAVTVSARAPRRGRPPARAARGGQRGRSDSPLYSIGRVQTPTLAIVVRRELRDPAVPAAGLLGGPGPLHARGRRAASGREGHGHAGASTLPDGRAVRSRLGARTLADGSSRGRGARGAAADPRPRRRAVRQRASREPPPLLFDLTSLQRTANRRYGLSATATLEAAQALYERHKILTYPRTDSRHLTSDMAKELPKMFRRPGAAARLRAASPSRCSTRRPRARRRVFDDAKVHDHHAIIPTGKPVRLDELPRTSGASSIWWRGGSWARSTPTRSSR